MLKNILNKIIMDNQEQTNSVERISLAFNGVESNGYSSGVSIDDDGRHIIFSSDATNLVPNDTNNSTDTFIYDRSNKTVELINIAPNNTQADAPVSIGSISGDSRYITFASSASNLVANDTNGQRDIFVYDRVAKTTERVSVASNGTQANDLNLFNAISDDGRYVAFESMASNLVENDTNGQRDIFVYDRVAKTTERINVASNGTQANNHASLDSISDDGRYITFSSNATNLVANDTNKQSDVFVYDRVAKTTERVSVASNGTQANGSSNFGSISGDGRYIAFESAANNLVENDTNKQSDIFVYDRVAKTTERINVASNGTQPNGYSYGASISDDGRYIAFLSEADNLVVDDTNERANIFIYDRVEQTTKSFDGNSVPSISGNGGYVVFNSSLDNLVVNDTNQAGDVFLIDLNTSSTDPGTTDPGTTDPGTTDPGTTEPGTTDPGTTDPGTTDPGTTDPGTTDPGTTDPGTTDPGTTKPGTTEPGTTDPGTTEPGTTDPGTTDPGTTKPGTTEPGTTDPGTTDPGTTKPGTTEPGTTDPGTTDPGTTDPGTINLSLDRFSTDEVHRFYQFEKGFHLYTIDDVEIDYVREKSASGELSYQYEAEKFRVLSDDKDALTGATLEGVEAVYRFFNTDTGSHLYTTDEVEKAFIEENLPNYNSEGIKYHAFESQPQGIETIPVFRLLNGDTGSHLYTIEQSELNYIQENLPNFSLENNGEAAFYVFEL